MTAEAESGQACGLLQQLQLLLDPPNPREPHRIRIEGPERSRIYKRSSQRDLWQRKQLKCETSRVQNSAQLLTSCVTLSKWLNLSVSVFFCCKMGILAAHASWVVVKVVKWVVNTSGSQPPHLCTRSKRSINVHFCYQFADEVQEAQAESLDVVTHVV